MKKIVVPFLLDHRPWTGRTYNHSHDTYVVNATRPTPLVVHVQLLFCLSSQSFPDEQTQLTRGGIAVRFCLSCFRKRQVYFPRFRRPPEWMGGDEFMGGGDSARLRDESGRRQDERRGCGLARS